MNDNQTKGPISEGSITQHLAKIRSRMISEGLPVPPALRRGGSSRISTAPNANGGASDPRIAADSEAQSQLMAVQLTEPSDTRNIATHGKAPKTKTKNKKARNSMSDEDTDSEVEEFDDEDSDGEYGKPVARRTTASIKPLGKGKGRPIIKEEFTEDEEEDYIESYKAGEKRKRGGLPEDTKIDSGSDGEDSDDETGSMDEDGFVGSYASFLPVESVPSSPFSSRAEKSLIVTLKWGKAYHGQIACYQLAQLKLIEFGVLPPLPPEVDSDEEENEQVVEGVSLPQWSQPTSAAENYFEHSNTIGHPDAAPVGHVPDFDYTLVDPRVLWLGPDEFQTQQAFDFTDIVAQSYQPQETELPTNHTNSDYGHFASGSFGELVQTPVDTAFSQAGSDFYVGAHLHSRHNSGSLLGSSKQGSWTDEFNTTGGVSLDVGPSHHATCAHCAVQGSAQDHGLSRYNSENTNTTQSSSLDDSMDADFPHGIPVDPMYGAGTTVINEDEEIPRLHPSHYDPEDEDHTTEFDTDFKWAILE